MVPLSTILVITVLGVGGPPAASPSRLQDATVTVTRGTPARTVAASPDGRLTVHLRPGLYAVVAALRGQSEPRFCEAAAIEIQRERRATVRHLTLRCSIK